MNDQLGIRVGLAKGDLHQKSQQSHLFL